MLRKFTPRFVALLAILIGSQAYGQGGFDEADANDDKKVDAKELKAYVAGKLQAFDQFDALFKELDADKNNAISDTEFENRMAAIQKLMSNPPQAKQDTKPDKKPPTRRKRGNLKVGDVAPGFKLKSLDGKSETDLASFKGKKPVVLIFGSYT